MEDKMIQEIEKFRQKMVLCGMEYGLQHPLVLYYSTKIDVLHNQLLKLQMKASKERVTFA